MKRCFAYIRVSTAKQGERSSSLQEQRSAIEHYASKHGLEISRWYEEIETAAALGRRIFGQMLADLKASSTDGIILHKVDRGARNLRDWASIGDLIDAGIEVHFAHESLDLNSRGGRLAADVQAVVAADYIRNLRDEVKKGFYGRLKQGFLPLPAPLGYADRGGGVAKTHDPARAPLVRLAFELYATGDHSIFSLREELHARGLRNRKGGRVSLAGLNKLLTNPFYIGLIRLKRTKETFAGVHEPLVSRKLFDHVQERLHGRGRPYYVSNEFEFRRLVRCRSCNRSLIGEYQKTYTYYRCHTRACKGTCVREEHLADTVRRALSLLAFEQDDVVDIVDMLNTATTRRVEGEASRRKAAEAALAASQERLSRLTDAFVDGNIDKEAYEQRREELLKQKLELTQSLRSPSASAGINNLGKIVELAQTALLSYDAGSVAGKRSLLKTLSSNFVVDGKNVVFELRSPFSAIAKFNFDNHGGPPRGGDRTASLRRLISTLEKSSEKVLMHAQVVEDVPKVP